MTDDGLIVQRGGRCVCSHIKLHPAALVLFPFTSLVFRVSPQNRISQKSVFHNFFDWKMADLARSSAGSAKGSVFCHIYNFILLYSSVPLLELLIWARSSVWESVRFASVRSRVRSLRVHQRSTAIWYNGYQGCGAFFLPKSLISRGFWLLSVPASIR